MIASTILLFIWAKILAFISAFWGWLVSGSVAVLAFMFSPAIRKYTLAVIAALIIGTAIYIWGYNSNHHVQVLTHTCTEFRKWLVSGPATDKALAIFQRHGLCL